MTLTVVRYAARAVQVALVGLGGRGGGVPPTQKFETVRHLVGTTAEEAGCTLIGCLVGGGSRGWKTNGLGQLGSDSRQGERERLGTSNSHDADQGDDEQGDGV